MTRGPITDHETPIRLKHPDTMYGLTTTIRSTPHRLLHCLVWLWLMSLAPFVHAQATDAAGSTAAAPHVLLLLSYDPEFPTSRKIIDGVRQGLGERRVDLQVEFMHTRFDRRPSYLEKFADWLADRLATRPPDVVIAADDNAFDFARSHRRLLADAPIVFLGVNNVDAAKSADDEPDITGVVEHVSLDKTLDLIQATMPTAEALHVITDGSVGGQSDLRALTKLQGIHPALRIVPHDLQRLTWSELGMILKRTPTDEPVLLLAAYKDSTGQARYFDDSVRYLLDHSGAPIFHPWSHGIREGLIGGWVMSHRIHGEVAAKMALRILDGAPAGDIPVVYDSPNTPMINAGALETWGLSRASLPENTVYVNAPESLMGRYPRQVTGAILVFLVLIALLFALMRANHQRARLFCETAEQRALLGTLIDASPDLIFFKDVEGRFRMLNEAGAALFGRSVKEVLGTNDYDHFSRVEAEEFRAVDRSVIERGAPLRRTEMVSRHDGGSDIYDTMKAPVKGGNGELIGIVGVARRITTEYQTSDRLQLAAQVFEHAAEGIVITSPRGIIEMINPAFTRITGYTADEVVGQKPNMLHSGRHGQDFYETMWSSINNADLWQGEVWNRRKSGEVYPEWLNISTVRDENGNVAHYLGIFSDISDVKHSEQKLEHMAHHDALTGLPNRVLLNDRIDTALRRAKRAEAMVAVIFLDLDRFKDINDSFGHATGDEVLKQVARRLVETVRTEDTVARLGGDEFVILMEDIETPTLADQAAERILACLHPPLTVDHHEFFIGGSLGISMYPRDGADVDALIRNADTAMYQAKRQGRNIIQRYAEQQTESARHRMRMETSLRRAVEDKAFEVWLQPQVELGTGKLTGFEALCRWPKGDGHYVPPIDFIPMAEVTGLIVQIGEFVLRETCRTIAQWRAQGLNPPPVAVNVSGRQLRRLDFLSTLCTILEEENCRPEWLELEVTESDILKDAEPSIATLHGIREMGISLSLDDFGTGFSSLSYLKRLPIQMLKIDRSFVDGLPADANDRAIVTAVLAMGRSLGLRVLAEGVETAAQVSALRLMGCNLAQGYRFGRPAPANEFTSAVEAGEIHVHL